MAQCMYLLLQNGRIFKGQGFGAVGEVIGEIVFGTGMTGYMETITDPSYYGQIVVQTFPLIGNVGVISDDFEAKNPALAAYVVREICEAPSNFRNEGNLDHYCKQNGIVGLSGVDTRALTKIIREVGVMNAAILSSLDKKEQMLKKLAAHEIDDAVGCVTCREPETMTMGGHRRRVVLWDFGAKESIRRELLKRGCEVVRVPASTTAQEVLALKPDGVMLSNGPGDPVKNGAVIEQLRVFCESKVPTFGICLGHQLFALAQGARSKKLKYGHRGANQPARDTQTGRLYITSQNHGYTVLTDLLPSHVRVSFENANDGTCEGLTYTNMPAFTVQFHPEASAGPRDTSFLFDRFMEMMD